LADRVVAFQHLDHHRARAHELDQGVEEAAFAMHRIEALGLLAGEVLHLGSHDLKAGLLESAVDLADDVLGDRVGLDDGNGALQRHCFCSVENWKKGLGNPAKVAQNPWQNMRLQDTAQAPPEPAAIP
jgi:hypothetical protein